LVQRNGGEGFFPEGRGGDIIYVWFKRGKGRGEGILIQFMFGSQREGRYFKTKLSFYPQESHNFKIIHFKNN